MNQIQVNYDPFSPDVMRDPQPFYKKLRAHAPVYRLDKYDGWALSRFDDVYTALLERDRLTDSEGQVVSLETLATCHNGRPPPPTPTDPLVSFTLYDPPLHSRLRRAMAGPLHPSWVMKLKDKIRAETRSALKALVSYGTFDANFEFASHVSCAAVCHLIGLHDADIPKLVTLVNRSVAREPGQAGFSQAGQEASAEIGAYIYHCVARRRSGTITTACPLIDSLLADRHILGRPLTDQEITVQVVVNFIGAIELLPKVICGGLVELWRHPDQRASIAADRKRVPGAFEEMARLHAPAQWFGRTLLCDMEVAGTPMRAGERLFLLMASANRDEREFENPDSFQCDRKMRRTVTFGVGPHFCSGVFLARLEAAIMIEEFLNHIADYDVELDGGVRAVSEFQLGWTKLPVRVLKTA